jgi:AcrR family transcriptional regulator
VRRPGLACGPDGLMASSPIMQTLTIRDLERGSGVPRSTIYYYVREGLLPIAQKAAASRAVYSETHLELLGQISELKREGRSLDEIRDHLAPSVASAGATGVDLVAEQAEQTRQSILVAAARLFARRGYKRTRVVDIMAEVGVTPPVFYSHFPSKQQLFIESFGVFVDWMRGFLESRLSSEPDPTLRNLERVQGYFGVQALSPDLMALVRSEGLHEDDDMRRAVERSYKDMCRDTLDDLVGMRKSGNAKLPAIDELVAFSLLGGVENVVMRASWDSEYSTKDVLWTVLCVFLAVKAVYSGKLDLSEELAKYAETVELLASSPPLVPPAALS